MLYPERTIFQIPVYRRPWSNWAEDEERRAAPYRAKMAEYRTAVEASVMTQHSARWQCWDYNEVVAWIGVAGFHDILKVEYWVRKGKRLGRHTTHPFEWVGKLTETWVNPDDDNQSIAASLRTDLLQGVDQHVVLRRRYVDLRAYDQVAPFLDWHSVLDACGIA